MGFDLNDSTPDHSSVSRTRRMMEIETHQEVFGWILTLLAKENVLKGKTMGIDATTLEANAALRSIVRRDTGEKYHEYLTGLAKASGIETPTRADLTKLEMSMSGAAFQSQTAAVVDGKAKKLSRRRSTRIDDESVVSTARRSCAGRARLWSGVLRTATRRAR